MNPFGLAQRLRAVVAAWLLCAALPVASHGLYVTAHAEQGAVVGLAAYSDHSPAAGLFVEITDAAGREVLAQGVSGDDGRFRIGVPERAAYHVAVEGEEGHRAEVNVARLACGALDGEALRLLREDLSRLEHRIQLRDVLGGLGYIVGLFGLAAWFMARRRM
ncbi:carboxypeptidase regulatory-like domain-containing protein [Pseudothauera hydrothermalis]|jgi:nickel transport protein|uniref:carboxypeptidase regulatory-like domain-containing protein n=1 Tax=Pseudothauera hydrothermalis TaxID=2184083 RepID=UPI000E08F189|nr:carboxypeptidase regulatory-like domain-containing protein [Pseudothauera hydrothermalis]